jgi:hypothetical protein
VLPLMRGFSVHCIPCFGLKAWQARLIAGRILTVFRLFLSRKPDGRSGRSVP